MAEVGKAVTAVAVDARKMETATATAAAEVRSLGTSGREAAAAVATMAAGQRQATAAVVELRAALEQSTARVTALETSSEQLGRELREAQGTAASFAAELRGAQTASAALAGRVDVLETRLKSATREHGAATDGMARHAAGARNLGQQFGDLGLSIAGGISPARAFGQQAGQIGYAMGEMGGKIGKVGAFLTGPWGIGLTIAAAVLAPFVEGFSRRERPQTRHVLDQKNSQLPFPICRVLRCNYRQDQGNERSPYSIRGFHSSAKER